MPASKRLIKELSNETEISPFLVEKLLIGLENHILNKLKQDANFVWKNFGSFRLFKGQRVVPAKPNEKVDYVTVSFKASKFLKNLLS